MGTYADVRDKLLDYLQGDLTRRGWSEDQCKGHKAVLETLATTQDLKGAAKVYQQSLRTENDRLPDLLSPAARVQYSATADKFLTIMANEIRDVHPEADGQIAEMIGVMHRSVRKAQGRPVNNVVSFRRPAPVMK